jgi:hypothetical protein
VRHIIALLDNRWVTRAGSAAFLVGTVIWAYGAITGLAVNVVGVVVMIVGLAVTLAPPSPDALLARSRHWVSKRPTEPTPPPVATSRPTIGPCLAPGLWNRPSGRPHRARRLLK